MLIFQNKKNKYCCMVIFCLFATIDLIINPKACGQEAHANFISPSDNSINEVHDREILRTYLKGLSQLRIYVARGPGLGHQVVHLRAMHRLRTLGFEGEFEVIYYNIGLAGDTANKLTVLVPGFNNKNEKNQIIDEPQTVKVNGLGNIRYIPQTIFQSRSTEKLPLAIVAADDDDLGEELRKLLNVDTLLMLQPRQWGHLYKRGDIYSLDSLRQIILSDKPYAIFLEHLFDLGIIPTQTHIEQWDSFLKEELPGKPWAHHHQFFQWLGENFGQVDIMPVYSIDWSRHHVQGPSHIMNFMITALQKAKSKAKEEKLSLFKNKIVIPIFAKLNIQGMNESMRAAMDQKGIPYYEINNPRIIQLLSQEDHEIIVVHVGATPPHVMDAIVAKSTLPVLLEGKNLFDLVRSLGLPFLSVIKESSEHPHVGLQDLQADIHRATNEGLLDERGKGILFQAFSWMKYSRVDSVAQYFMECKDPDSSIRKFFHSMRIDPLSLKNDLLAQALLEVINTMSCSQILD